MTMSEEEGIINPAENFDKRLSMLEYIYIKKKSRNVDGQNIPQVGLFLRPDAPPMPEHAILLEEEPLVFFWEGEYDIDEGQFPIERSLAKLSAEAKAIYDTLYCSPELADAMNVDEGRWFTNRFRAFVATSANPDHHPPTVAVEAIYRHASSIDHSCMNSNARYKIFLSERKTAATDFASSSETPYVRIIATRKIQPDEEILIHYDYEQFHHPVSGNRTKTSESVHSDLYDGRGLLCGSDCIFGTQLSGSTVQPSTWSGTPDVRRRILKPLSPTAVFRRNVEENGIGS